MARVEIKAVSESLPTRGTATKRLLLINHYSKDDEIANIISQTAGPKDMSIPASTIAQPSRKLTESQEMRTELKLAGAGAICMYHLCDITPAQFSRALHQLEQSKRIESKQADDDEPTVMPRNATVLLLGDFILVEPQGSILLFCESTAAQDYGDGAQLKPVTAIFYDFNNMYPPSGRFAIEEQLDKWVGSFLPLLRSKQRLRDMEYQLDGDPRYTDLYALFEDVVSRENAVQRKFERNAAQVRRWSSNVV